MGVAINSRFDDVFGHNQIQKARLDAYLSDIDISNKSFKITQSEFLINIIYLLFCDRENLTNFKATVFLQNKEDEKLELVNFDYYKKVTDDLLFSRPLPNTSGFGSITENIGKVQFTGTEFALYTDNLKGKDFSWTTNFNIAFVY